MTLQKKAPDRRLFYCRLLGWLGAALVMGAWLNPNHYAPWVVFENEAMAFAGCLLLAAIAPLTKRDLTLKSTYTVLACITALLVLLQYGLGMISWQCLCLGGLYLIAFALSAAVGHGAYRGSSITVEAFETRVMAFMLLTTIVSSGVVLGQWLQLEEYYPSLVAEHGAFRPFGNLGQPNNQATLLLTGVIASELLLRKKALGLPVACVSLFTLLPAIAVTGSRTAFLAAVAAAAYLFIVGRTAKTGFTWGWLLMLLVCFVVLPKLGVDGESQSSRLGAMLADSPRLHIYEQLKWAIADQPWTGYGWMQTAYAQSLAAAYVVGGVETDYAHNIVIDLLIWFGIPVGILLLLALVLTVVSNWRRSEVQYKLFYALLIPFVLHSLLEFPFAYAFFLLPIGMLLGYLGKHAVSKNEAIAIFAMKERRIGVVLLVLTSCLAMVVCVDYLELAEDFRVLRFEHKNVGKVPQDFQTSSPLVLTDLKSMMELMRYIPGPTENAEGVKLLRQYVLHTHSPSAHVKLISQDILNRRYDDALGEIRRFKNLYGVETVRLGIGSLLGAHCGAHKTDSKAQRVCIAMAQNDGTSDASRQQSSTSQ